MKSPWPGAMMFCVVVFYSFFFASVLLAPKTTSEESAGARSKVIQTLKQKEETARRNLAGRPELLNALSLFFAAALFWGLFLDVWFFRRHRRKEGWPEAPLPRSPAAWRGRDVFVAFTFLLFAEAAIFLVHDLARLAQGKTEPAPDAWLVAASLLRDLSVAAFVWILVKKAHRQGARELGLRFERFGGHVRAGLLAYLAAIPPLIFTFVVIGAVMKLFSWEPEPQIVVQMYLKPSTESFLLPLTVFVALAGPVMEEIFFRGFAYAGLRNNLGACGAAFVTAFAFALLHMNLTAFAPIFLLGLFLAYLYEVSGSLVPSIAAHIFHNGIMVSLTLGFKSLST